MFNDGSNKKYPWLSSAVQQGAGLINSFAAINSRVILDVSSLNFNDTEFLAPVSFRITNTGTDPVTYTIGHIGAGTTYTLPANGSTIPITFDPDHGSLPERVDKSASLTFSPSSVSVPPGQHAVIQVVSTPPSPHDVDIRRIPIYSGYVTLQGANGDSLSIPYLGAANAMRKVTILDPKNNYLTSTTSRDPVQNRHMFTFSRSKNAGSASAKSKTDLVFKLRLSMGTRILQAEVISANGIVLGSIPNHPQYNLPRTRTDEQPQFTWAGKIAGTNGNAPPGIYSFRVRALKIFGNPQTDSDYDVIEIPQLQIQYTDVWESIVQLAHCHRRYFCCFYCYRCVFPCKLIRNLENLHSVAFQVNNRSLLKQCACPWISSLSTAPSI